MLPAQRKRSNFFSSKKSKQNGINSGNMLNMQTSRTVNNQSMQQVILKTQPSAQYKSNETSIPYQTMDTETNTVRYDTGRHFKIYPLC